MSLTNFVKGISLAALALAGSGCEQVGIGYSSVEADQAAVVYQQLPQFLGGGLTGKIVAPGTSEFIMPWQSLIKISTGIRELTWEKEDKLKTRTRDGNMLILELMVRYRVDVAPTTLLNLVQLVSVDDRGVEDLVSAVTRSDVRLYFNKLNTEQFLDRDVVEKVQVDLEDAMSKRLQSYGIIIELFKLKDFHFQTEYQNILDDIQEAKETTSKVKQKKATVKALKEKRIKEAQEEINRIFNQAEGELKMASIRGEQYLVQRKNEAEEIMAKGRAEVAGMEARLKALSGPGGANMLKIEIVKGLLKSDPKFVILNQAKDSNSQMNIQKVDTNDLLQQLGLIEGMQPKQQQADGIATSETSEELQTQNNIQSRPSTPTVNSK